MSAALPQGPDPAAGPQVLVITGMSGAGKSTAAHVLEDLGWYVVDNVPPQLIPSLAELSQDVQPPAGRLGVVVDVRVRSFFAAVTDALGQLEGAGIDARVLFLDAGDEVLVRRFESVRRPHPLQADGRILDGILAERAMLAELRSRAHLVVDTSRMNVHQLSAAIADAFGDADAPAVRLTVMSFGFKYGLPLDADHVVDVRFIPNPYWIPDLRSGTGLDPAVSGYVLGQEGVGDWVERYLCSLEPVLAGYVRENRRQATVAVGCTGGKHRSVALAEVLAARLRTATVSVSTVHRDLGRE